eukprot:TRINITY_DN109925_c0_g1_i1.p1 TRINITY_DN109925_c0_g1~~TRINITY_DN109925_c0_g1_i1.p1  ORF type:complete len:206 (-),score=45.32 TRINITY_DN109925_c0_g1_i1:44-661(-)
MLADMWATASQTCMSVCRILCQAAVCICLVRIIANDFRHLILGTLRGTASKPSKSSEGTYISADTNDLRLSACKGHLKSLRELSAKVSDSSEQGQGLLLDVLGAATDLARALLPGDDEEICQAMYEAVEPAFQALDYGSAGAVLAAKRFLDMLENKEEILAESQIDHLKMLHETGVALDDLMTSAMDRHYKASPFVDRRSLQITQ